MNPPIIKAFILCTEITDTPGSSEQKDLRGAGLGIIRYSGVYPFKFNFWVYLEIAARRRSGRIQLALMRADSGQRRFFPDVPGSPTNPLELLRVGIRLSNCELPDPGVYFIELWYDGLWLLDQRFEVVDTEGERREL